MAESGEPNKYERAWWEAFCCETELFKKEPESIDEIQGYIDRLQAIIPELEWGARDYEYFNDPKTAEMIRELIKELEEWLDYYTNLLEQQMKKI